MARRAALVLSAIRALAGCDSGGGADMAPAASVTTTTEESPPGSPKDPQAPVASRGRAIASTSSPASHGSGGEGSAAAMGLLPGLEAPPDATARLGQTLVIGDRPQIVLQAPTGWRAQGLCFGLVGDAMLFVQSRDKDVLVLVLDSCAVSAERCAADAYLAQTGGARDIRWEAGTRGTLGVERAPVTVVPGVGALDGRPAQFWQVLHFDAPARARATRQILVALASRAGAERKAELAALLATVRLDPRGGRLSTSSQCRDSPAGGLAVY
jgi:hypothetical protein